jgi:hypothetical protein
MNLTDKSHYLTASYVHLVMLSFLQISIAKTAFAKQPKYNLQKVGWRDGETGHRGVIRTE